MFSDLVYSTLSVGLYGLFTATFLASYVLGQQKGIPAPPKKGGRNRRRLVVVTGADSGFGRMLVEQLSLSDQDTDILALTLTSGAKEDLTALKRSNLVSMQCDVTNETQIDQVCQYVTDKTQKEDDSFLYALVNNAGIIVPGQFVLFDHLDGFQKVMDVNLMGQVRMVHKLLPLLLKTKGSRIINTSSTMGVTTMPGSTSYCAAKYAIEGFSETLRRELRPLGVHVIVVRPGNFKTDMPQKFRKEYLGNWNNASDWRKAAVGGESFKDKFIKGFDDAASMGQSPQIVVNEMIRAIQEPSPWHACYAGWDAKTLFRVMAILPYPVSDFVSTLLMPEPRPVLHEQNEKSSNKID
jgi:dehydrogenase/reductase SDR family protein 9